MAQRQTVFLDMILDISAGTHYNQRIVSLGLAREALYSFGHSKASIACAVRAASARYLMISILSPPLGLSDRRHSN